MRRLALNLSRLSPAFLKACDLKLWVKWQSCSSGRNLSLREIWRLVVLQKLYLSKWEKFFEKSEENSQRKADKKVTNNSLTLFFAKVSFRSIFKMGLSSPCGINFKMASFFSGSGRQNLQTPRASFPIRGIAWPKKYWNKWRPFLAGFKTELSNYPDTEQKDEF